MFSVTAVLLIANLKASCRSFSGVVLFWVTLALAASEQLTARAVKFESVANARGASVQASDIATVRGTVTAFSGWKNSFFLQDSTGAISVDRLETTALQPGDDVELTGRIQPGLFANVFMSTRAMVLGHGRLPKARGATYSELRNGDFDSRLVEINGTIHAAHIEEQWGRKMLLLDLQTGDAMLTAYLLNVPSGSLDYLVDSEVRVKGVCGTIFNDRRQLIGLRLFAAGLDQIETLAKGRDPALIATSALNSLLTLHGPALNRRVHVKGTVTYDDGGNELFLQEGRAAIRILNAEGGVFPVGTQADAWGFVSAKGYLPVLQNSFLRASGMARLLGPIRIKGRDAIKLENGFLQAPYDGLLVHLDAKIVNRLPNAGSLIWTLAADGAEFQAQIAQGSRDWALSFESGAQVSLTGICVAEADENENLKSFHILLRSPADMRVVQAPYWSRSLLLLLAAYLLIFASGLLIFLKQQRQEEDESNREVADRCLLISRSLTLLVVPLGIAIFLAGLQNASSPLISLCGPALLAASSAIWRAGRERTQVSAAFASWLVILTGALALASGGSWKLFGAAGESAVIERMPQVTAVSLLLIGCASLWVNSRRQAIGGQLLAVLVAFTTWLKLVSILYATTTVNGLAAHLMMSTPSAIALLALSLALLFATPNRGLMKTVCSPRLGGLMLRRLVPAALLLPVIVGWLRLQLQVFGLVDTRLGLSLFALSSALLFCTLLWSSAAVLNRLDRSKSQTEEELRERQSKLDLVFETRQVGDFSWEVTTDRVTAHGSVWRMYGEPEKRGSELSSFFAGRQHPDDRAQIAAEFEKVRTERRPFDLEFRVIWPDASIHWIYCRAFAIFDQSGAIAQTIGINLDITDRKLAEAGLRQSEVRFRELADAMPQIVWTSGKDGFADYYNRRWYEYTGLSTGQSWREIVREEDFEAIANKWQSSIEAGEPYENEVVIRRSADGSYRWHLVRAEPVLNAEGKIERWFGTCTDIDDFKRASREIVALNESLEQRVEERSHQLAHAEKKYRLLIESVKDYAIYMLDEDGNVTSWNSGAERLKGYKAGEIIGKHFSIFYSPEEVAVGGPDLDLAAAVAKGRMQRDGQQVRQDGGTFWASILISPVYDGEGQVRGFSKVVRDITDWRRASKLLISAQRRAEEANKAKSSFLAAMSHEIRTPMNAILGMADLLWETELKPLQRDYVGRFQRAGANLLTLINDILDLSKIEAGRFELEAVDFDLLELVDRVLEIASPKASLKQIELETQIVPNTPAFLIGDPVRLQQILNNLIGNAIKFTESGRITLRIGARADGKAGHLEFAVADTGIGIPADKLSSIFEDFTQAESSTTRRFGGTGLGLGICRRLVRKMDGELKVESVAGEGSTFRFDVVLGVSTKGPEVSPTVLANLTGSSVLIVDDNATNRVIVSEMCAGWGMKTRCASSAAQAFALLEEARQLNEQFSLILLDKVLPGVKGFEALEEIRRNNRNVPVIISSSDNQSGDITGAKALGAAAYLMKPIRRTELLACILNAISGGHSDLGAGANSLASPTSDRDAEYLRSLRIMVAEDAEDNRFLVQAYLADKGCDLTFAENGLEAVEACRNAEFDVILMDVQMPVMDGLTATARIRMLERELGRKPAIILAVTADALVEDSQRSRDAGCDAHLAKPISKSKLIAAMVSFRERFHDTDAPSETPSEAPGIDIPEGFEEFSRTYLKTQQERLEQVQRPLAADSVEQLRALGHKMKGTGTSYGFPSLTALGAALEEAAKAGDLKLVDGRMVEVEQYLKYASDYLCEEVAAH